MKEMKRCLAAILLLVFMLCALSAPAEETETPVPLYRATATCAITIRAEPSRDAEAVGYYAAGARVLIVSWEPEWLQVVKGDGTGWIIRHTVTDQVPIDKTMQPFGWVKNEYVADIGSSCVLREAPDDDAQALVVIPEGERLALLSIENGWGKVMYWRTYAYLKMDKRVASIEPILPVEDAQAGDILSAYCSFYPLKGELVPGRLVNIRLGCEYICRVVEPGERFSFNEIAGPYGPAKGYKKAMSFYDGGTAPSYGGGTCQVSSTLYNVLMPLSGRGIDIVYRRSHGASGATYLPHGTDAAVGSDALDFIFRNEFDFPVRIDARSHDQGVVYIALIREE